MYITLQLSQEGNSNRERNLFAGFLTTRNTVALTSADAIVEKLDGLPGTEDLLFRRLWKEGRLEYRGCQCADDCDVSCARLVCASIRSKRPLLIELPDSESRRPALLFATALLRYWTDWRDLRNDPPAPVVYFGSHIGIREHLSQTRISGMVVNLGGVFEKEDLSKGSGSVGDSMPNAAGDLAAQLPKVITVYAPADPVAIIQECKPGLVAIDLGESPRLSWLQTLLKCTSERRIRTIAWGQNPLSECSPEFSPFGLVFVWPPQSRGEVSLRSISHPARHTVVPYLVGGSDAEGFSDHIRKASRILASAGTLSNGRFSQDALAVHWGYLRCLESLHVPADLYEAEAPHFWGMKSLHSVQEAASQFRKGCVGTLPELGGRLEEAVGHLEEAQDLIIEGGPPIWRLLTNVCIAEPEVGAVRLLTFTSRARYELFAYALLARYNISSDDLRELRIVPLTAEYLAAKNGKRDGWENEKRKVVVVGLPGPLAIPKMLPIVQQSEFEILVYPHQLGSLKGRIAECNRRLQTNLSVVYELSDACDRRANRTMDLATGSPTITVGEVMVADVGSASARRAKKADLRLSDTRAADEVARLFEVDEDTEVQRDEGVGGHALEEQTPQSVWCERAFRVEFDGNWEALFSGDARINVVGKGPSGEEAIERPIESLKPGEKVLFIQGQERQVLYDLLIARVHKHPAFELHLALVKRWQDDLIEAFFHRRSARSVPDLLKRLQEEGSRLVSPLTLRFWLARSTLCPSDPEDLRRLGDILDLSFVQEHYKRIAKAAERIRGLHRGLAHRLNHWLQDQLGESKGETTNDLIDSELGLRFSDFKNSLVILQVETVTEERGLFLRSRMGRLEKKER